MAKLITQDAQSVLIVGGVALLGVYFVSRMAAKKAVEVAGNVGEAIDPTNSENIFYSGANAVGESITGDEDWTLGGAIFEAVHGDD